MTLRRHHNDSLTTFPTPSRTRDIHYPSTYRDYRTYPYRADVCRVDGYRVDSYSVGCRRSRHDYETSLERKISILLDRSLDYHGDLGWSLEYATAYCYKQLNGNRPAIVDAIDRARELDLNKKTPFIVFDHLDRALFQGRLNGMVHLRWKAQASSTPGTTSVADMVGSRICIELNSTPFEDDEDPRIDDLLDALIHQMIHAYFIVCCGSQPKGGKQDGRLLDALHFGVILSTIRDITHDCQEDTLELVFYAAQRQREHVTPSRSPYQAARRRGMPGASRRQRYIAINPRGSTIGPPPADGQSHCMHDNSKFTAAMVKNWQVENYARCIDLEMDAKGDIINDMGPDGVLIPTQRLKGPPSATYVELIWSGKRVMVPKEKALKFASLKKPIEKDDKRELKLPDCSLMAFRCLYDFINLGSYWRPMEERLVESVSVNSMGPPILVDLDRGIVSAPESADGMISHIKVFKLAETLKFEELQNNALHRLYEMPTTSDDPIGALKELYNEDDKTKPIHAELHKWARNFLARTERITRSPLDSWDIQEHSMYRGSSNYEKILLSPMRDRFQELYVRNLALKDDCKLVVAELTMAGQMPSEHLLGVRSSISALPHLQTSILPAPSTRSTTFDSSYDPLTWQYASARSATAMPYPLGPVEPPNLAYLQTIPAFRSGGLTPPLALPGIVPNHTLRSRRNARGIGFNMIGESYPGPRRFLY